MFLVKKPFIYPHLVLYRPNYQDTFIPIVFLKDIKTFLKGSSHTYTFNTITALWTIEHSNWKYTEKSWGTKTNYQLGSWIRRHISASRNYFLNYKFKKNDN